MAIVTSSYDNTRYRLVPIEPTSDMMIAGGIAWADAERTATTYVDNANACWRAMLKAVPAPSEEARAG